MKLFTIALMTASITFFSSCAKEGCTDSAATNFSAEAKNDDGTCSFESSAVFYYDQATSQFLLNDGATNLTFYVDGRIVGSSAVSVYWTSEPDCGSNGSITVTKPLGGVKTQSYSYSVVDQTGWEYWSGTLNFNANTCTVYELN